MQEQPATQRQLCFQPPYCPNENCEKHVSGFEKQDGRKKGRKSFHAKGWSKIKVPPQTNKRYECLSCNRSFSHSTFKLDYRVKKRGLYPRIFDLFICGVSNRHIGRMLGCSEYLVRERLKKMAQWTIVKHTELTKNIKIKEPIAYDGLENFSSSQYDPNHIQQCIGSESLFIYDFNYSPLNRKGRMTQKQKVTRSNIEAQFGRYDTRAIRKSTKEIFSRLHNQWDHSLCAMILLTDEHFQYDRVVRRDLKHLKIKHVTISSKDPRNFQNILFPVNHSDLLIRQHVGAYSRETICFAKKPSRMIQKFALFLAWKNYFRSLFVKEQIRRPGSSTNTPAMELGITKEPLKFHEFFDIKRTLKQVSLNREWLQFYNDLPTYQRDLA